MTAAVLLELAMRCEREEPSHELDKAILRALGYTWRGMAYWYRDDSHTWKGQSFFTSSLEAAVTLVPEGAEWWEIYFEKGWEAGPARAEVGLLSHNGWITAFGKTSALALCAAALRARAVMDKAETERRVG